MTETLTALSLQAHGHALQRNQLTPSERPEWAHHPMRLNRGVPVFDAGRMRPDQVWDVTSSLQGIVERYARPKDTRQGVHEYMAAYGSSGARLQDVQEAVKATKPIVLKYLREMIEEGTVLVREEQTRGKSASRRKRYYTIGQEHVPDEYLLDPSYEGGILQVKQGKSGYDSTGIVYHGTGAASVVCPCGLCRYAFEEAILGDMVSESRRRGDTGFVVGLRWRIIQRRRAA